MIFPYKGFQTYETLKLFNFRNCETQIKSAKYTRFIVYMLTLFKLMINDCNAL